MEKIVLNVEGMSCSHCENRVKKALTALDGVAAVAVDLASKKVTVDYDAGKVAQPQMKAAIEDAGYTVA